jgi:predicted CopG family antitoxin
MVKTITIKDTVYEELKAMKEPGESFSDLFERLTRARRSMEILKKISGSVTFKDKKAVLDRIKREREEWR